MDMWVTTAGILRFGEAQVEEDRLAQGPACGTWLKLVDCEEYMDGEVQETHWGRA